MRHKPLQISWCVVGNFPIKCLGIPLHYEKLRREEIHPLTDNILKRIVGWRGKRLSLSDKIKAC